MFPPFPTFYQLRRPNCELYYLDHIFHWVIMVADFQFATLQSKSFFLSLPSLDMCPMIKIRSTHWNHSLSYSSLTGHLRKLNSHSNKLCVPLANVLWVRFTYRVQVNRPNSRRKRKSVGCFLLSIQRNTNQIIDIQFEKLYSADFINISLSTFTERYNKGSCLFAPLLRLFF